MRRLLSWLMTILAVTAAVLVVTGGTMVATERAVIMMVRTGSMDAPGGIPAGSLVVGWTTDAPAVGQVVVATRSDGERVMHRVVALAGGTFTMRGDANDQPDDASYATAAGTWRVVATATGVAPVLDPLRKNPIVQLATGAALGAAVMTILTARSRRVPDGTGRHRAVPAARDERPGRGRRSRSRTSNTATAPAIPQVVTS